ncbi:MAG: DUF4093 domain-containing protein [Ruminococcaceae bacterium]|nr:DUF4093 domain-containing protein [Oscillospiraceae bacterium]
MMYLDKPVIVEGKYDKIKLSSVISSPIITTDGFNLFNNAEKSALIRKLAQNGGVIVITDSDGAGKVIRGKIKNIAAGCPVENIYIPQIKGKEKRKTHASREGYLGVEGMDTVLLESLLQKYISKSGKDGRMLTKTDLYELGLSGGENSKNLRCMVCRELDLPHDMSANALMEAANLLYSYELFIQTVKKVLTSIDNR